jgi:membrane peptidoglycan carboxypeptidase
MKRTRSGKIKRRNILWRLRRILVGVVAISVLAASAAVAQFWSGVQVPAMRAPDQVSYLCDSDVATCDRDTAFAEYGKTEAGVPVRYDQIPPVMIHALIAAEDKDFLHHQGVDPTGIARAAWVSFRREGKGGQQGGSTLTQQLVKYLSKDDSLTIDRKVTEAVQAMKLERQLTKEEILTAYFNSIYYGRNARGLDSAVRAYFGVDFKVEDIKVEHAAFLASLIREPEFVDPNRRPEDPLREKQRKYATSRRVDVLNAMVAEGYIQQADRDRVAAMGWDYVTQKGEGPKGNILKHEDIGARYWRDYVNNWIKNNTPIDQDRLLSGGLRVYTSFSPDLQRKAYDAVNANLGPNDPEVAMAAMDDNGYLRVMVGGRDLAYEDNLAVGSRRNTGSVLKPFVLAEYLKQGRPLDQQYENKHTIEIDGKDVSNSEPDEPSPVTVDEATALSSNTIFVTLIREIGIGKTLDLMKAFGINTDAWGAGARDDPRAAIGQYRASVIDVTSAYNVLANRGQRSSLGNGAPVTRITNSQGVTVWEPKPTTSEVIPPAVADQVNWTLRQVIESEHGTARERGGVPHLIGSLAGKTGTHGTSAGDGGISDAWFAEYTCKLTATAWVGRRIDAQAMGTVRGFKDVYGGTIPAKIVAQFMAAASGGIKACPNWELPANIPRATTTTTATTVPSTRDRPTTTDRRRPGDPDDPDQPTTTRRTRPTLFPPTTDDDETTTTRRGGGPNPTRPGEPTTTRVTIFPRPGQNNSDSP